MSNSYTITVHFYSLATYLPSWIDDSDESGRPHLGNHIILRLNSLFMAPTALVAHLIDTVISIITSVGTLITLGMNTKLYNVNRNFLLQTRYTLSYVYYFLLKTINTRATMDEGGSDTGGLLSNIISLKMKSIASNCGNSTNVITRHVFSRMAYFLCGISTVVMRIVDLVIGLIAMIVSFLTLGKFKKINDIAYKGLTITGVIEDIFINLIHAINPWAREKSV